MAEEQNAEHVPAQVGSVMVRGGYSGHFITCSCQADRFGEGPKIPAAEYPAHVLANTRPTVTTAQVRDALRSVSPTMDQSVAVPWLLALLDHLGIEVTA